MTVFFIWVSGLKGPTCEILYGLEQNKDSHNRDRKQILQQHKLLLEYKDLTLNQLALIYPYKENENENVGS